MRARFPARYGLLALALAALTASCDGDGPSAPADRVDSLHLSPEIVSLASGDTVRLTLIALQADGTAAAGVRPTWASSAEGVARVDSTGLVTAVTAGTATISATVDGARAEAAVLVTVPGGAGGLRLVPEAAVMQFTWHIRFEARHTEASEPPPVRWSVSDPEVLAVDQDGLVRAVGIGTAMVSAELIGNPSVRATAPVTVEPHVGNTGSFFSIVSAEDGRPIDPQALFGTVILRVFSGDAPETAPERVDILVDDEVIASVPYSGGPDIREFTWDTSAHANGPHVLTRRTVRGDGHEISSAVMHVRIAN